MNIMENKDIKIGLVIMASGLGKRFGGNKLIENLEGKPLIKWVLDSTENIFDRRIVVTRSKEVKNLCDSLEIESILHALPNRNDTVNVGLSEIMDEVDYCFFTPGDQPLISRESVYKLVNEAKNHSDKIVRTGYKDRVGAPIGFPKTYFAKLLDLPIGKGGSYVARSHPEIVRVVKMHDECELWDIDTMADLDIIRNKIKGYFS